jgi:proteic killer suppression protein
MDVEFADSDCDRLEIDPAFFMKLPSGVVKAYRSRIQGIRSAIGLSDLSALTSWHFKQIAGSQTNRYSMKLSERYRLTLELISVEAEDKFDCVRVIAIEENY